MSYTRLYPQRINWEDEPSLATPINQVNLNKMDSALYGIDGRVVELDENKVDKTETFNTTRNGVVPKPTQADITNEKVLRADGVWVEQSGGGGGGGGHTYVDKDDEQMPPRGKAKFTGGLNLTDDSENNRTIVDDNYEIIPWATWKEYSDAEKAEHPNAIVTGAPDCDGTLEIENMHLAWSNPNPTVAFPATEADRTITLDTDDYDDYIIRYAQNVNSVSSRITAESEKGKGTLLNYSSATGSGVRTFSRGVTYVDATHLSFGDCTYSTGTTADVVSNTSCIPIEIYTFKKKLTAKIKAIAHDVSTDASKCMLDENTSVADALGGLIKTYKGTKSYTCPSVGQSADITFALSTPTGYKCIGIMSAITNTGGVLCNSYLYNNDQSGALAVTNIGNTGQAGTTRTAQWTEVYVKDFS